MTANRIHLAIGCQRSAVSRATFAIALVLVATAPGRAFAAQAANDDVVVASAGAVRVSHDELLAVVREERASGDLLRLAAASTVEGIEKISRRLLEQKLMAQGARVAALDRDPSVARALAYAADRLLADAFVQQELSRVDMTEAAMRRYYQAHTDRFRSTPRRKARHIVVRTREDAEAALAAIGGGRDFADVAREQNTDATKASGGDLGWVSPGVMVKSFDAALFALDPARVSDPVETSFGWHLIRIDQVDPGALPPFELIAERVANAIKSDVVEQMKAKVFEGLTVNIDRQALGALVR
jgi:peptidyl-prolyl cis-trans isomerase C